MGDRSGNLVTVRGYTNDFGMGGMVTAYVRTKRGVPYSQGATVLVSADGTFRWSRVLSSRKTLWVYFTGGGVKSNILRLTP